jgi:hypothetical protein
MTPEPTDKLDAAAHVAVNGPADDTLLNERIVRRCITGPDGVCLSRMLGNGHVRLYVPRTVMLKASLLRHVFPAQLDLAG